MTGKRLIVLASRRASNVSGNVGGNRQVAGKISKRLLATREALWQVTDKRYIEARVAAGKPVAGTQVTIIHQGSKASNLQFYKSTF